MDIWLPVILFLIFGAVSSGILFLAAKFMEVKESTRFSELRAALPGVNCGACGYTGCDGYAKALDEDGAVKTNLCVPGGDSCSRALSDILGVAFEDVEEQVATVHCIGDCRHTGDVMKYEGIGSCSACNALYRGKGSCNWVCFGYGDCVAVCQYNALSIVGGIAVVNRDLCTGCGMCVGQCPNRLIEISDLKSTVHVTCCNLSKGNFTRAVCSVGCISCGLCEKACPEDAIHVIDNLARVDHAKCTACGACVAVCPTKVIQQYSAPV